MKPLEGIKVLELATVVAAPTAGRVMQDYGAEVIKIETLAGDELRRTGGNFSMYATDDCNPMFTMSNSGKKIIPVNMKDPKGKEIVDKLMAQSDVIISNIRLASLERLGFGYEAVKARYPKIIYAHFSGYGMEGPDRNMPGFDMTAFWLRNGPITDWKEQGTFPMHPGYAFGDVATSNALLSGILMALLGRQRTGQGTFLQVSLMGSGIWCNYTDIISSQKPFERDKTHDQYHQVQPFDALYECADKRFIGIYCNEYKTDMPRYARLFGMEDIIDDPRYESVTSLHETGALRECIDRVSKVMIRKTTKEWAAILTENRFTYGIAATAGELAQDPQAIANRFVEPVRFADGTEIMMPTPPIRFSAYERNTTTPTQAMGTFTQEILAGLGYSAEEICSMREERIVR